eukprot:3493790-Prymnesium_polylepis.1
MGRAQAAPTAAAVGAWGGPPERAEDVKVAVAGEEAPTAAMREAVAMCGVEGAGAVMAAVAMGSVAVAW